MERTELVEWLALNSVAGIGARLFGKLLEVFGSPGRAVNATREELQNLVSLPPKVVEALMETSLDVGERERELAEREGILALTLRDDGYPKRLREIPDPPPVLYVKGELREEDETAIAVVGSRQATAYGRIVATKLAEELVREGITIVSGMARGIDTHAHWSALRSEGRTLAVWGAGLMECYPEENRSLAEQIALKGALLSCFPLKATPDKWTFPVRNRIISGLSLGVVVVEAGSQSGALITAELALEQGRDVFAVPGNITSRSSVGANRLIKQGAKLVQSGHDITEELFVLRGIRPQAKPAQLGALEAMVLDSISEGCHTVDAVAGATGLSVERLLGVLTVLEMKGCVSKSGGQLQALT